jgi:hypothetical protein
MTTTSYRLCYSRWGTCTPLGWLKVAYENEVYGLHHLGTRGELNAANPRFLLVS